MRGAGEDEEGERTFVDVREVGTETGDGLENCLPTVRQLEMLLTWRLKNFELGIPEGSVESFYRFGI